MASSISLFQKIATAAFLLPIAVHADTATPVADSAGSLGQLLLGFATVIVLLFASLWVLKRLSLPRGQAAGLLRVVAGTAVGTRERVVILEVGSTWLVLGVAPGQISTLAEIPRSSLPEKPETQDFAGWLRRTINRTDAT